MINANKQILRQLKALNDNSGQPQPEVRIEQPDSQVRQRGDLQPANGDNGNGTPPIVHTYVTTTTTEIFPPSCVCLYLGVAIPIFVTIFSWVLAKCLGIFQQI
ncbi:hypothetical protein EB796_020385 [Bugula neritina]|uniref:Uncharacterized protein n=1 Tax=Bugula neritina TaxID=10212 RepID=A0A7J7J700_BUGNE|nr:hypothetical protein EB796_020385 [Bugula neritina]